MYTILPAPLPLPSGSYLFAWVTHTYCWREHASELVWASAYDHNTAVQACASLQKHNQCVRALMFRHTGVACVLMLLKGNLNLWCVR